MRWSHLSAQGDAGGPPPPALPVALPEAVVRTFDTPGFAGMTFYEGERFPGWRGDLLVGALSYQLVSRLDLDDEGRVIKEERFLEGELGRIRDVRTGPDGLVYLLTDEDPGGLYRLEPAAEAG